MNLSIDLDMMVSPTERIAHR
uniref:TIDP3459 n=1 Tax=Arundo donax TaxID=35708 RepID=A0A0A9FNF5_ARUDO